MHAGMLEKGKAIFLAILLLQFAILVHLDHVERLWRQFFCIIQIGFANGGGNRFAIGDFAGYHAGFAANTQGGVV